MKPIPTPASPAFHSASAETGARYSIYVHQPDPHTEPGPWPVVLLMDGDYFFDPALEAAAALRADGAIPPLLIVGVGYGAGFGEPGNNRSRDYTPTASALEPKSGGADLFLSYLTNSLWPELTRRYPLRQDVRAIAGHSLGSLLVLYAVFQPRPFFTHILAGAPSLWWDDRALLAHVARLRDAQASLPASVFLGVGHDDTESMTGDLALFEAQLASRPFTGLRVVSERFPDRDHYNAAPDCLRSGLRALFGAPDDAGARPGR